MSRILFILIFIFLSDHSFSQIVLQNQPEFSGTITYSYKKYPENNCKEVENIDSMRISYFTSNFLIELFNDSKLIGFTYYNNNEEKIYRLNKNQDTLFVEDATDIQLPMRYDLNYLDIHIEILNYKVKGIDIIYNPDYSKEFLYAPELYINPDMIRAKIVRNTYFFHYTNAAFLKLTEKSLGCTEVYEAINIEKKYFNNFMFNQNNLPIVKIINKPKRNRK